MSLHISAALVGRLILSICRHSYAARRVSLRSHAADITARRHLGLLASACSSWKSIAARQRRLKLSMASNLTKRYVGSTFICWREHAAHRRRLARLAETTLHKLQSTLLTKVLRWTAACATQTARAIADAFVVPGFMQILPLQHYCADQVSIIVVGLLHMASERQERQGASLHTREDSSSSADTLSARDLAVLEGCCP